MKNPPIKRKPTKEKEFGYKMKVDGETFTKWCRDKKERDAAVKGLKKNPSITNIESIERIINPK